MENTPYIQEIIQAKKSYSLFLKFLNIYPMFLHQNKPIDYDCGYNLDLMIKALPRIEDIQERINYAKRIVGLIKQSHPSWVNDQGQSEMAWDFYFENAAYNPEDYGIQHPFKHGVEDDAR